MLHSAGSQRVTHDLAAEQQNTSIMFCLVDQLVNNLLAMQETLVQFLGLEDSLDKG